MQTRNASITAQAVAANRALELSLPHDERICHDPYAPLFLDHDFTMIGKYWWVPKSIAVLIYNCALPGLHNALVARARHGDEYLQSCVRDGVEQVVILGAGFDTRAYRFKHPGRPVKFIEVDHPATQAVKQAKVANIFGRPPTHVAYVPIDFTIQSFDELLHGGYDASRKTLFLWEGVTCYIPRDAVELTLRFVASHATAGSRIFFDFISPSVVAGTSLLREAKKFRKVVQHHGEPLLFGMEHQEMRDLLMQCGFCDIRLLDSEAIHRVYFTGRNKKRYVSRVFSFAEARVC